MAISRLVSLILRGAELVFAAIVAGVNGQYLHQTNTTEWRFVYTEVVSGIAIFFALIWLIPFSSTFTHWWLDLLISVMWWVSFGVLAANRGQGCGGVFDWGNVHPVHGDQCGKFKATLAFAFISAILWLASGLIGLLWTKDKEHKARRAEVAHHRHHRRWYRRSVV